MKILTERNCGGNPCAAMPLAIQMAQNRTIKFMLIPVVRYTRNPNLCPKNHFTKFQVKIVRASEKKYYNFTLAQMLIYV